MKNSTRMSESATMSTKEARMGPFVLQAPVSARASATMSSQRKGKRFFTLSAKIAEEKRGGEHDATAEQHGCGDAGPAGIEQVDENEEDAQEDDGFDGLADAVVFQQIRRNDHGVEGEEADDDDEAPGRSAAGEIDDDAEDDAGDEDPC